MLKTGNLVIFGNGKIADVLAEYFERDSGYEVVGFTCEADFVGNGEFRGRPVVPFDEVERHFPPAEHDLHVAVGYHQLNRLRERLFAATKGKGYRLASFVSSRSWPREGLVCGENCFVADGVSVEPGAALGNDVALWSNVVIGHHSKIGDHAWLAAGTVVGGSCEIGTRSFLALNVTVGNEVIVGEDSLLGARTLVTKSLAPKTVVIERDSEPFRLDSEHFLKISRLR